ncbi:hypothetical protein P879_00773 [Paragonimus westermani]|uniref:Ion transport N-terminal domain-containing protein n=1 Tax=Paragonimus westermani TaxID=34504 RepID=A0A8T0DQN2_9TREM|nr:hypothetical protein P879_00773 [Paragonimus westermani]
MPVELLGQMSADTPNWLYGEKSTKESLEVNDNLVATDYQPPPESFRSGILQVRSQLEVNRPKISNSKGIRRMHSTAVDSHYASAIRQRRNREYNLSQADPIRTVTFHELECPEEKRHRLTRNPSLESFPNMRHYHLPDVQLNGDYSTTASPLLNRSQLSHTADNGQAAADKATSTNAFVIPSNSAYSVSAMADGNFIEQGSEYAKQSTSSYLKEQFLAFFQPSDNKLAMKLFGSKNALLKEKRRQEQQGKWVIHPCSSFR